MFVSRAFAFMAGVSGVEKFVQGYDGLFLSQQNTRAVERAFGGSKAGWVAEPEMQTIGLYSEDLGNSYWKTDHDGTPGVTVTTNTQTAPDGALTADTITETGWSGHHDATSEFEAVAGEQYSASTFVKQMSGSDRWPGVDIQIAGVNTQVFFDISDPGLASNVASGVPDDYGIIQVDDDYFRIFVTATATATVTGHRKIKLSPDGTAGSYPGNAAHGAHLWGSQFETGAMSSYVPTSATPVTRAADLAVFESLQWFIPGVGSFFFTGVSPATTRSPASMVSFGDDPDNFVGVQIIDEVVWYTVTTGGVVQASIAGGAWPNGTAGKMAMAFAGGDFAISVNGAPVVSSTGGVVPQISKVLVASDHSGAHQWGGFIASHNFTWARVSNSTLVGPVG